MTKQDEERQIYFDAKEYQSKFLLTPDINEEHFEHIDKNFTLTNLKHYPKLNINEPEEVKLTLKSLHILNGKKYFKEKIVKQLIGYKEENMEDGSIIRIPVYENKTIKESMFPKTFHLLKSSVISTIITASARNGWRFDKAITNKLVREESLQDKTEVKSGFFSRNNQKNKQY